MALNDDTDSTGAWARPPAEEAAATPALTPIAVPTTATALPTVPFNRPYMVGTELDYVRQAHGNLQLAGDGQFTALCSRWLERNVGCSRALLTPSCTAALEMAAILCQVGPGDEVIMPSYTFVSTANAFALRGGLPVFVDIRPDTLNIDERLIEAAITERTKVIVVVHYAGVGCDMDAVMAVAARHRLLVVEDAAQGLMASWRGRPLGGIGHLGAVSFHETKNITSGEGGALLVNDPTFSERAQFVREKGTNRTQFLEGRIDKYTWLDIGSSYLPSEMTAAFLWGQMEAADDITQRRIAIWNQYHRAFAPLEQAGRARRPITPDGCIANAHMYYLLLAEGVARPRFLRELARLGVDAVSHYVPLHSSPAGRRLARCGSEMTQTVRLSERLVRLPLWLGLEQQQAQVIGAVYEALAAA